MIKSTEVMSIKEFMNRDYHMDAFGPMIISLTPLTIPAILAIKSIAPKAVVAYKALPLLIL